MGLRKREYTDKETIITAENMNDIQDAVIALEDGLFSVDNDKSGEVITITDAAKRGFRSLNIYGKTTQDGTPTPDAPVDLVSVGDAGAVMVTVARKNLISNNWRQGMFAIEDGITLTINNYWVANTDYIAVHSGEYYMFSADTTNFSCVFWYDKDKSFISHEQPLINRISKALKSPDNAKFVRVAYNYSGATEAITPATMGVGHYVQLEFGATATEYEPYNGKALAVSTPNGLPGIPVASGGNYTDANGQQWICDEIDFARGVYVQRVATEELKETAFIESWDNPGRFTFPNGVNNTYKAGSEVSLSNFAVWNSWGLHDANKTVFAVENRVIYFSPQEAMTSDEVNAMFAEMIASDTLPVIVAQLANPIETPLSEEELAAYAALHTYKNHTTVFNDAGAHMELEYAMDAKKYIDGLITGAIIPATVE